MKSKTSSTLVIGIAMEKCEVHHESFEPMDIDLSINSSGRMDITKNFSIKEENDGSFPTDDIPVDVLEVAASNLSQGPVVKKYHINIQRTQPKVWPRIYLTSLFVFVIAIITYNIANIHCINDFHLTNVRETLSSKLYGQELAIKLLSEVLEAKDKTKILFLYGGTGVGKTYSISLLMQNMWDAVNVYHFTTSSFTKTFTTELCFGMTLCKSSIYIIDDLSTNDFSIKNTISDIVQKSDLLDKAVTIILIFNCDSKGSEFMGKCDNSFNKELDLNFSNIKGLKKYILFKALKREHLIRCIESELGIKNNKQDVIDNLIKNFEVERDGCKGVHTKMKLLKVE